MKWIALFLLLPCSTQSVLDDNFEGGPRMDDPGLGDASTPSQNDPPPPLDAEPPEDAPNPPDSNDGSVNGPTSGSIAVTLWPGPEVSPGSRRMAFGVPFPRNALTDVINIRVLDTDGDELPSHATELVAWHAWSGSDFTRSVRAALVWAEVDISSPGQTIRVDYGAARSRSLSGPFEIAATWRPISSGEYPDEYPSSAIVSEPAVCAAIDPGWLSACGLRSHTSPIGEHESFARFDELFLGFSHTAVNDVDPRVTEGSRIDYIDEREPWLFDRAMTLFGAYIRSGDVKWIRHAHRAAQYYARRLDSQGYTEIGGTDDDLKYSYGQSLVLDLIFTGDTSLLAPIRNIANAGLSWDAGYERTDGFWTERHQAYALLAALSAWEATGESAYATRARDIVSATLRMVEEPGPDWPMDGCALHSFGSHEGGSDDRPTCSPWMSALLGEAIYRYYLQSSDRDALELLAHLGNYLRDAGTYISDEGDTSGLRVPWYLASSLHQESPSGPSVDIEHACDVAGLAARGAWAAQELGDDATERFATARELFESCEHNLESWYRPGGPAAGLTVYRLSPARKYNWWFGTTHDLPWLLSETPL